MYEERVESSATLLDLDDEFRENNLLMIERFFTLFDRIVRWYNDFIRYLDDVDDGVYIQHTLEAGPARCCLPRHPHAFWSVFS